MSNKKQYYKLDDIGFVGIQDKRSAAETRKDIEMTVQFIKNRKAELASAKSRKRIKEKQ